ncbi:MAG TPA: peptidylprolyl isomerase [Polyangiaceae bacterium]|nr:peptidylprolyl isomerase [Polyangiaceae bacterium]
MKRLLPLLLLSSGCVVTTLEGPGDPPRVAPPPGRAQELKAANEAPIPTGPETIGARHLLVSYRGAMRASPTVTRTKEEARARVAEALEKARGGAEFEDLVKEYSDEPGAAERGGDLGKFKRTMMVKPFADAAFKLAPGELSDVVETPFGFHVIQRTE